MKPKTDGDGETDGRGDGETGRRRGWERRTGRRRGDGGRQGSGTPEDLYMGGMGNIYKSRVLFPFFNNVT